MTKLQELARLCRDYRYNLCNEDKYIIEFMSKWLALSKVDRSTVSMAVEKIFMEEDQNNV